MESELSWTVLGYEDRPLPSLFRAAGQANDKLALFLPGFTYPLEAPLFHYGMKLLEAAGFDLLGINYRYNENREFLAAADDKKGTWLTEDALGIRRAVVEHDRYTKLLLFGKSLGTIAMHTMSELPMPWERVGLVWLTPATPPGALKKRLEATTTPSLVIIGSADEFYRKEEIDGIASLPHTITRVIPNADHSLEYPADVVGSARALPKILGWLDEFAAAAFA